MHILYVNGIEQVTAHDKTLISFLRDDLRLTATKDIEGLDRVLIDGVPAAAREVRVSALHGCAVITAEGADLQQRDAFRLGDQRQLADDINVPRQVYVRPIFGCPGARLTGIDMSQALENVRFGDCLQKADIPGSFDGMAGIGETVLRDNQVVALVVSTYLHELDALCRAIRVTYDTDNTKDSRPISAVPCCATALYHDDDTLTIYSNGSDETAICRRCAAALDIPETQIRCICSPVENAQWGDAEVYAALTAWLTQQSAKIKY